MMQRKADMRVPAGAKPNSPGHWELHVEKAGRFDFEFTLSKAAPPGALLSLKLGEQKYTKEVAEGDTMSFIRGIDLPAGPIRLEAWLAEGDNERGVRFAD